MPERSIKTSSRKIAQFLHVGLHEILAYSSLSREVSCFIAIVALYFVLLTMLGFSSLTAAFTTIPFSVVYLLSLVISFLFSKWRLIVFAVSFELIFLLGIVRLLERTNATIGPAGKFAVLDGSPSAKFMLGSAGFVAFSIIAALSVRFLISCMSVARRGKSE